MKKIAGLGIPLFFILPWVGFLLSLFDLKSKKSAIVYIAFAMVFGYAFSFSDSSADSYRYAEAFARFDNTMNYNTLILMYQSGELKDLYRLLLFYFTSLFSSNPKVMYAFAGLIYGIISYLNLRIFVKKVGNKWDVFVFILALVFYTYVSLSNINGFRFWTGGMLLFYATYSFIIEKKTRWILGVMVTPLFHYGFILIVPILILYKFIHPTLYNSNKVRPVLFYIFIVTFILSWVLGTNAINLGFLSESSALSGAAFDRIEYINSEDTTKLVAVRAENSLFLSVQNYFVILIKIYVFIVILFINKLLKKTGENKTTFTNLFAFVLFFYSFAFIAASIPSGGRFMNIAHLFLFVLLVNIYVVYKNKNFRKLIVLALPVFGFTILFTNVMLPILVLSPTFWYGNFFWIISEGLDFYF